MICFQAVADVRVRPQGLRNEFPVAPKTCALDGV